jgi:hypothetical protein
VLRHEGRIGADNKVIAVEVSALGAAGLLSELCLATLTLATPVDGLHEVVCKFAPTDVVTRITLNLFELSKTEYLAYRELLPKLPASIMRPTMLGGDFNFTSNKVCLMLERVPRGLFLDQDSDRPEDQPTLDHFERIFETLAVLHAHFWDKLDQPGLAWINKANGEVYKIAPKECKKHWGKFEEKVRDPGPAVKAARVRRGAGVGRSIVPERKKKRIQSLRASNSVEGCVERAVVAALS